MILSNKNTSQADQSLNFCQLYYLDNIALKMSKKEILLQRRKQIQRAIRRRWNYLIATLKNLISGAEQEEKSFPAFLNKPQEKLRAGDAVRVLSEEEIRMTLDKKNQLKGCVFMSGMWDYCGTTQRVLKRVQNFMDERDRLMKRTNGIVLLEGAICTGTEAFGPCDRSCFFFWREEWLEKI